MKNQQDILINKIFNLIRDEKLKENKIELIKLCYFDYQLLMAFQDNNININKEKIFGIKFKFCKDLEYLEIKLI